MCTPSTLPSSSATNSLSRIRTPLPPFWIPSDTPPGPNVEFLIVTPDGWLVRSGSQTRASLQLEHAFQPAWVLLSSTTFAFTRSPVRRIA